MLRDPTHWVKGHELSILSRITAFQHKYFCIVNRCSNSELIFFGCFKYPVWCCSQKPVYFSNIVSNHITCKYLLYVTANTFCSLNGCSHGYSHWLCTYTKQLKLGTFESCVSLYSSPLLYCAQVVMERCGHCL